MHAWDFFFHLSPVGDKRESIVSWNKRNKIVRQEHSLGPQNDSYFDFWFLWAEAKQFKRLKNREIPIFNLQLCDLNLRRILDAQFTQCSQLNLSTYVELSLWCYKHGVRELWLAHLKINVACNFRIWRIRTCQVFLLAH